MASSKRSTARAKSSATTSPGSTPTSTSSQTRSTSSIRGASSRGAAAASAAESPGGRSGHRSTTVVLALGSNLGDRALYLRRAIDALAPFVRVVRISSIHVTEPVDAPLGSPLFYNMVVTGYTSLPPLELLDALQGIEAKLGRVRRVRNAPRTIDLDLLFYGALRMRSKRLTLPHPRWRERTFVTGPLGELMRMDGLPSVFVC